MNRISKKQHREILERCEQLKKSMIVCVDQESVDMQDLAKLRNLLDMLRGETLSSENSERWLRLRNWANSWKAI